MLWNSWFYSSRNSKSSLIFWYSTLISDSTIVFRIISKGWKIFSLRKEAFPYLCGAVLLWDSFWFLVISTRWAPDRCDQVLHRQLFQYLKMAVTSLTIDLLGQIHSVPSITSHVGRTTFSKYTTWFVKVLLDTRDLWLTPRYWCQLNGIGQYEVCYDMVIGQTLLVCSG